MAENITLANLVNLQNETTAVSTINNNNAVITSAFTDVLSRSGVSPNPMGAPLDMNSWPIMNLPPPGSANSPARLVDVTSTNPITISLSLAGDVTAPASSGVLTTTLAAAGTSGHKVPYLDQNNTWSGTNAFNAAVTLPNNTVTNASFRQGVAKSVVGVTGNATANVADIAGTTRQVLAINTAGTALAFSQPQGDQLLGTITNDNATTGNIGEYVSSFIAQGSAISITNNTPTNLTSISLTAGDWDVYGAPLMFPAGTTSITAFTASLSTTSVTSDFTNGRFVGNTMAATVPGNFPTGALTPVSRFSLSGTTTIFLVIQCNFTASTMTAFGGLWARRVR